MYQTQDLGGTALEQCLLGNTRKSKEASETRHSGRGGGLWDGGELSKRLHVAKEEGGAFLVCQRQ